MTKAKVMLSMLIWTCCAITVTAGGGHGALAQCGGRGYSAHPVARRACYRVTQHSALSSAIANDTYAKLIFAQQAYVYSRPSDVLIGISTSGSAANVVNALNVAGAFGLVTIGLTGSRPSAMDELCDVIIKAPAAETFRVQDYHLPIYHTLCLMVEEELFGGVSS